MIGRLVVFGFHNLPGLLKFRTGIQYCQGFFRVSLLAGGLIRSMFPPRVETFYPEFVPIAAIESLLKIEKQKTGYCPSDFNRFSRYGTYHFQRYLGFALRIVIAESLT